MLSRIKRYFSSLLPDSQFSTPVSTLFGFLVRSFFIFHPPCGRPPPGKEKRAAMDEKLDLPNTPDERQYRKYNGMSGYGSEGEKDGTAIAS
jgi:hypothetical protein